MANEQAQQTELTDQQILELTSQIKNEHAQTHALVGSLESIQALQEEYADGSEIFTRKINWLQNEGFQHVRRLRGDGDCFYRAVSFALISSAVKQGPAACEQLLQRLKITDPQIYAFADKDIVDDFSEPVHNLLGANETPLLSDGNLLEKFNQDEVSNSAVVYFRLLASAQLRVDADEYFPFLFAYEDDARILDPETGMPSITQFCSHYVEATGRDADHIAIQALTKALGLSMRVAYLDQSKNTESGQEGRLGMTKVDFVDFAGGEFAFEGKSVLLLRPGHYDILS